VLHQVGVSFDLYYDARKHKIKTKLDSYYGYAHDPVTVGESILFIFINPFVYATVTLRSNETPT